MPRATVTIRPPGSSTRASSRSVATGSSAAITESRLTTASNDASANGNAVVEVGLEQRQRDRRLGGPPRRDLELPGVRIDPGHRSSSLGERHRQPTAPAPRVEHPLRAGDGRDDLGAAEGQLRHCSRGSQPKRRHAMTTPTRPQATTIAISFGWPKNESPRR